MNSQTYEVHSKVRYKITMADYKSEAKSNIIKMSESDRRIKVVIVGGGLVGALNAIFFSKTDRFDVLLCEKRLDIRMDTEPVGRSINLSLSHRGREALRAVGLEDKILKSAIRMYARMIHDTRGNTKRILYGRSNEFNNAVDRKVLNELLLTEAESSKNVTIKFGYKLVDIDLKKKSAKFHNGNYIEEIQYDLLVGNDGAYSTVRQLMAKSLRFDFSQEYISHGYKELYFPPGPNNTFIMDKNCLHIWPRNEFMLIGLPNPGGSFTGTLFMPFEMFDKIKTNDELLKLFSRHFPDALELIGKSNLEKVYFSTTASSMVTIKCKPYNFEESCVIMGDAAHAMVPFYGQGMNCGFEDLLVFHEILKENNYKLENTCSEFTERRNKDAKTICDLAFYNYVEMRKSVSSKSFLIRKKFDNLMNFLFPSFWVPLYSMVSFSRIPYSLCLKERRKQDRILTIFGIIGQSALVIGLMIGYRFAMKYQITGV